MKRSVKSNKRFWGALCSLVGFAALTLQPYIAFAQPGVLSDSAAEQVVQFGRFKVKIRTGEGSLARASECAALGTNQLGNVAISAIKSCPYFVFYKDCFENIPNLHSTTFLLCRGGPKYVNSGAVSVIFDDFAGAPPMDNRNSNGGTIQLIICAVPRNAQLPGGEHSVVENGILKFNCNMPFVPGKDN